MTSHFLLLTFLLTTLTLQNIYPTTAQRSLYGESCNKTVKCDRRSFLTCTPSSPSEDVCGCSRPDEMMYDPLLSKCVSRAGEACRFVREEIDEQNVIYEVTACVSNANCNPDDGFCSCGPSFFENSNGTCTPAQTHGQPCNSQMECSRYQALHCHEGGSCQCDLTTSIYSPTVNSIVTNPSGGQCIGLAGQACINGRCIDDASCRANVCGCDSKFYEREGQCVAKIGIHGNCTDNLQCGIFERQQLTCQNGICDCNPKFSRYGTAQRHNNPNWHYGYHYGPSEEPFYSFEGPALTQCLGLAGSGCLDKRCVPRAYCPRGSQLRSVEKCRCRDGYTQSKSGNCGHAHGQSCDGPDSCIDGLVCRQKICQCPHDNQQFDSRFDACVSTIGGPCNATSHCIPNSECIFSGPKDQSGHCTCENGFVENSLGSCDLSFGSKCSADVSCDGLASLVCIDGICGCAQFAQFDSKLRKCVGLAGAKCALIGGGSGECVENAGCEKIHPKLDGRCQCLEGFEETDQYTCQGSQKDDHEQIDRSTKVGAVLELNLNDTESGADPFKFNELVKTQQSSSSEEQ